MNPTPFVLPAPNAAQVGAAVAAHRAAMNPALPSSESCPSQLSLPSCATTSHLDSSGACLVTANQFRADATHTSRCLSWPCQKKWAAYTDLIILAFIIHSSEQSPGLFVPHINKSKAELRWQLMHVQNNSAFDDC